jgi:site-specific recombinase XerD
MPHVRAFECEFRGKRLPELTGPDVEQFVSVPEAAATGNRRLTTLRLFLKWAHRKRLIEADPTAALAKEREDERSRVLTEVELATLIHGFYETRRAARSAPRPRWLAAERGSRPPVERDRHGEAVLPSRLRRK